jgi:stage V sporulation protein D (sporulation-specific penicillin-binding protein)
LEDFTGLTETDAVKLLKAQNLTAQVIGNGETVTGQIPAAGQVIPGNGQVLLYLGDEVPEGNVKVPDFAGMNRAQAAAAAGEAGLYILVTGSDEISPKVVVTLQDIPAGTEVPVGTTIRLQFTDTGARD